MAMDPKTVVTVGSSIYDAVQKSGIMRIILGSYSDGTIRSIPDAIHGEVFSPKQKAKALKKKKKKRKTFRITDIL